MFILKNNSGLAVLMRTGKPFTYSNRELALMGKKHLQTDQTGPLTIVER